VLDYAMIFGKLGFPQWGIGGAAIATVISSVVGCVIYFVIFVLPANRRNYGTTIFKVEFELFKRLMKFGIPSGVQFMLDIFGFSLFIVFVGRIDAVSFAATSMAFQINSLAFMPMIGFGIATSVLVGRSLGADKPQIASKATFSASYISFAYMIAIAIAYIAVPDIFMLPFKAGASAEQIGTILPMVRTLLRFVAFYCIFDTGNIIFSAALKGAGDTRFVMYISLVLNWVIMVIPSWAAVTFLQGSARLYGAWLGLTGYVCALAILFFLRFLAGKWKTMRVIEKIPILPDVMPAVPTVETKST
jgi:MATE family multidrug resistance protein